MSISLKVVSMALVFCAVFNRSAIFNRILFIFTLCSDLVPVISLVGSDGGNCRKKVITTNILLYQKIVSLWIQITHLYQMQL